MQYPLLGSEAPGMMRVYGLDCGLQSSLEALGTVGSNNAVLQLVPSIAFEKSSSVDCPYYVTMTSEDIKQDD